MSKPYRRHKKAKRLREERLLSYLSQLVRTDPRLFLSEWRKRERSWIEQIHHRARNLRRRNRVPDSHTKVFDVLEIAEWYLSSDPKIERLVGAATRGLLRTESVKALGYAVDPRLAKLTRRIQPR